VISDLENDLLLQESKGNEKHVSQIQSYREKIEKELADICADVIKILHDSLIPKAASPESKVFYHKMVGDYHRYLAEFSTADERQKAANASLEGYKEASAVAEKEVRTLPLTLKPHCHYYIIICHPFASICTFRVLFFVFCTHICSSRPQTPSAWVSPSTSLFSTTRCSTPLTVPATWPSRRSMTPLVSIFFHICFFALLISFLFLFCAAELDTLSEESYKDSTLIMQLLRDNLTLWTSDMDEGLTLFFAFVCFSRLFFYL